MEKTAKSAYTKLKKENKMLLQLIGTELEKRSEKTPSWAHVGDLGHSKELMVELLAFLRNAYDEEKMLANIEKELQQDKPQKRSNEK